MKKSREMHAAAVTDEIKADSRTSREVVENAIDASKATNRKKWEDSAKSTNRFSVWDARAKKTS